MIPGNNFSEIHCLTEVEDLIMEAIAQAEEINRRNYTVDEAILLLHTICEKRHNIESRLHEHRKVVDRCLEMVKALEEREDKLLLEALQNCDKDFEDADAIKQILKAANQKHNGWRLKHLDKLKEIFSRRSPA